MLKWIRTIRLLGEKIQEQKRIRILGDYDIDGIQSVYILYSALSRCGAQRFAVSRRPLAFRQGPSTNPI